MFDHIITVTLCPCLDTTLWVDSFVFDDPMSVRREQKDAGGKGLNVSRVLAALGVKSTALCAVGNDNAEPFLQLARTGGVEVQPIQYDGSVRENLTIMLPGDGKNERLLKLNRAAEIDADKVFTQLRTSLKRLTSASAKRTLVHFGGSLPKGVTKERFLALVSETAALGAKIGLDCSFLTIDDYVRISPFFIKPNIKELSVAAGKTVKSPQDIAEVTAPLIGKVEHILISMGGDGMARVDAQGCTVVSAPKVTVRSTVGAGDSSVAGYLYAVQKGDTPLQAMQLAVACGSACVELEATATITKQMAYNMLERITE